MTTRARPQNPVLGISLADPSKISTASLRAFVEPTDWEPESPYKWVRGEYRISERNYKRFEMSFGLPRILKREDGDWPIHKTEDMSVLKLSNHHILKAWVREKDKYSYIVLAMVVHWTQAGWAYHTVERAVVYTEGVTVYYDAPVPFSSAKATLAYVERAIAASKICFEPVHDEDIRDALGDALVSGEDADGFLRLLARAHATSAAREVKKLLNQEMGGLSNDAFAAVFSQKARR